MGKRRGEIEMAKIMRKREGDGVLALNGEEMNCSPVGVKVLPFLYWNSWSSCPEM